MLYHTCVDATNEEIKRILDNIMQVEACGKTAAVKIMVSGTGASLDVIWKWLSGRRNPSAMYLRVIKQWAEENNYAKPDQK